MFANLRIVKDGTWVFAEFTRDSENCKRLILPQAEEKAREIAESGDPYKIDRLARAIGDASFGEFRRQLEYKAAWRGKSVQRIDAFFPSSQLCHCCGYRNQAVKNLKVRAWTCPQCGATHDRDINAAKNILTEGLRLLQETQSA